MDLRLGRREQVSEPDREDGHSGRGEEEGDFRLRLHEPSDSENCFDLERVCVCGAKHEQIRV